MPRKTPPPRTQKKVPSGNPNKTFHIELLNAAQKLAWSAFQQHDVLFLLGPAGTGKTFLGVAFAIQQLLAKQVSKIVLTRPIVESGESLGYLPGDFEEKVNPYMMPMFDCMDKLIGREGNPQRDKIKEACEIAPLAYMRGRTFDDSICIFDEAQNASLTQLKLFLTRFGQNSKLIITGDPKQSDLRGPVALSHVVERLEGVPRIGIVEFKANSIVRHKLIGDILERLEDEEYVRAEPEVEPTPSTPSKPVTMMDCYPPEDEDEYYDDDE
jgi:phosphate starvation-inducible PhoH-like protein